MGRFRIAAPLLALIGLAGAGLCASPAGATCIDRSLEELIFYKLLNSQKDPQLALAGVSGSKFCGPVCTTNLMMAVERSTGVKLPLTGTFTAEMRKIVSALKERGIDVGRQGVTIEELARLIKEQFDSVPSLRAEVGMRALRKKQGISIQDIDRHGRASVIGMKWTVPIDANVAMPGRTRAHMLLVKRVDREAKRIYVIDPNYPKNALPLRYEEREIGGVVGLRVWPEYYADAEEYGKGPDFDFDYHISSIITVDLPEGAIKPKVE